MLGRFLLAQLVLALGWVALGWFVLGWLVLDYVVLGWVPPGLGYLGLGYPGLPRQGFGVLSCEGLPSAANIPSQQGLSQTTLWPRGVMTTPEPSRSEMEQT